MKRMSSRGAGRRVGGSLASLALCAAALLLTLPTRADPAFELSGSVGLGPFSAGAGPPRFAIMPTASFLVIPGERWLLRCDDAVTLLGASGGRFGAANTTTLSIGARWAAVNATAGLSFAEYSLPLCGARWCATVRSVSPGLDARIDVFHPGMLRGAIGLSASCGALWLMGPSARVWSGFSTRCVLGPILRLSSR